MDKYNCESLDTAIRNEMTRILACTQTCFGIPSDVLKLNQYGELLEKAEKYDKLISNMDTLFEIIEKFIEVYKNIHAYYGLKMTIEKAEKILSELKDYKWSMLNLMLKS